MRKIYVFLGDRNHITIVDFPPILQKDLHSLNNNKWNSL